MLLDVQLEARIHRVVDSLRESLGRPARTLVLYRANGQRMTGRSGQLQNGGLGHLDVIMPATAVSPVQQLRGQLALILGDDTFAQLLQLNREQLAAVLL